MAYREQRNLSGVLFRNDQKSADKPDTANWADAKGRCLIGGTEYYINAWTKLDKNGNKYQSLSFKEANAQSHPRDSGDQRQPGPRRPEGSPQQKAEDDPSCPF